MPEQKQGMEGEYENANAVAPGGEESIVGSQAGESGILNDVILIEAEFERALIFDSKNRERNRENWRMYSGIDHGQFSSEDVAQALAENRHLDTFNISRQKVDSLAGAILRNPYDPEYIPVEGKIGPGTNAIKQAWNCDKDISDWDSVNRDINVDALVYQGVSEMYISKRVHDLGNISWRRLLPGMFVFDPHWQTNNGRDCSKGWKVLYLTAKQIKSLWLKASGRIDREVAMQRIHGDQYDTGADDGVTPMFNLPETTTDRYRVISRYEMVDEEHWVEYDSMTQLELPDTDDLAVKIAFLNKTNDSWDAYKIMKRKKTKKVCYITTICPQISRALVLEHKPTEIQVGRLPFFCLSAARINGVPTGIIDLIKDVNRIINFRENLLNFTLETSAHGAQIGDPLLFGNDKKAQDDFVARRNRSNAFFWSQSGAIMKGQGIINVREAPPNADVVNQLLRMWDVADRISKAPAVSDARTEGSGESGYLFAQKTRIAEQQQYILFASIKQYLAEIAEAYFDQAKIQYSIGMFEREFTINNGTDTIIFNKKVKLPNGQTGIENDISSIPRHRVVISESPSGLTNRLTARALDTELLKVLPPENIGSRQILTSELLDTMDHNSEETRAKLKKMRTMEEKQAELTLEANIIKLETGNIQAAEQLDQLKKKRMADEMMKQGIPPEVILQSTGIDMRPKPPAPPAISAPGAGPIPPEMAMAAGPGQTQGPAGAPLPMGAMPVMA